MGHHFLPTTFWPNQWFSKCVPGPSASASPGNFGVTRPPGDSDAQMLCRPRAAGWGDCVSVCAGWDGREAGSLGVLCGGGWSRAVRRGQWPQEEQRWRTCAWQPCFRGVRVSQGRWAMGLGTEAAGEVYVWPLCCALRGLDCDHPVFVVQGNPWPGCWSWMLEETQNERKASSRLDSTSNTVHSNLDELLTT